MTVSAIPYENTATPGISFFSPLQDPRPGTYIDSSQPAPKVFESFKLRDVTFPNRILVSPMCQYSADVSKHNAPTPWHSGHLGGIWTRTSPGLTVVEATAVTPEGRISPQDLGLWTDEAIPAYKALVEQAHSLNALIAVQLAHAGRKASTIPPWIAAHGLADPRDSGFAKDVVGPVGGEAGMWDEHHAVPREVSIADIEHITQKFVDTAIRAVKAGFDVIEIHGAHGYLISSFLSPATNTRTDKYGGSFENRIRILVDIVKAIRKVIPEGMPLFVRYNGTEWLEHKFATPEEADEKSWTVKQAAQLGVVLAGLGVDLLDVSSGGNHKDQKFVFGGKYGHQVPLADYVRKEVKKAGYENVLVSAVGGISKGPQAEEILQEGFADAVFVGRAFQRSPALVWDWAEQLGVNIKLTNQVAWPLAGRGSSGIKK